MLPDYPCNLGYNRPADYPLGIQAIIDEPWHNAPVSGWFLCSFHGTWCPPGYPLCKPKNPPQDDSMDALWRNYKQLQRELRGAEKALADKQALADGRRIDRKEQSHGGETSGFDPTAIALPEA